MRKRFIVYGLRRSRKLCLSFIVLALVLTIYHIPYTIYAVDSTPSADIKSKLEELKREIASKAAKLKQEVNKKLKDKAYVGKVKLKSNSSLTLAAISGPKIVSINQDTVFESKQSLPSKDGKIKTKQKFSQKTLANEDFSAEGANLSIVALGDIDETAVLTAKKIVLLPASPAGGPTPGEQLKIHIWGQVIAISDERSSSTSKLVTIKNRDNKNIAVSLPSGQTVKLNNFVILTGQLNKNEIFEAEFIYVIPQGGFIKPKKIATPSAQPTR